jgi:BMFP domain-containing protein YqiC
MSNPENETELLARISQIESSLSERVSQLEARLEEALMLLPDTYR